jgi:hypothetical protein
VVVVVEVVGAVEAEAEALVVGWEAVAALGWQGPSLLPWAPTEKWAQFLMYLQNSGVSGFCRLES